MTGEDLINLQSRRKKLRRSIQEFFDQRDFLEVETPTAVICPGTEIHLDYFETKWTDHRNDQHRLWLRSSPELHMKQILAAGADRIYQIGKCFRNGGERSQWHHPEFTMLEWYQCDISYQEFMSQTEELLRFTWQEVADKRACKWKDFPSFQRFTLKEVFEEHASIDLIDEDPDLAAKGRSNGIVSLNGREDFETAFFKILLEKIEPGMEKLGAVILYDYPPSQSALARIQNGVAKRFEFYIDGVELCNAFYELSDLGESLQRQSQTDEARKSLRKQQVDKDEDFFSALQKGLPDCCGNALGLDRWLALLLGHSDIDAVIPFRNAKPYRNAGP